MLKRAKFTMLLRARETSCVLPCADVGSPAARSRVRLVLAIAFLLASGIANADVGVPMIVVSLPLMVVALIPVIVLESAVISARLRLPFNRTWKPVAIANVSSTFAGMPISWGILVVLQLLTGGGTGFALDSTRRKILAFTWQAPWMVPDLPLWMAPAAMLVLLIPFYAASVYVEYQWNRARLVTNSSVSVLRGTVEANIASYALLAGAVLWWLVREIRTGR